MFDHFPLILAQEGDAPTGAQAPAAPAGEQTGQPADGTGGGNGTGNTTTPAPKSPFDPMFLLLMVAVIAFMFIFSARSQKREKKKREAMLAAVKKGDKVQTVGGILGSVLEVRDSDVLVKVDENTNARIRFARSAIQSVIEEKE